MFQLISSESFQNSLKFTLEFAENCPLCLLNIHQPNDIDSFGNIFVLDEEIKPALQRQFFLLTNYILPLILPKVNQTSHLC